MVRGLDKFREYFQGYAGQYVFIGGTACDIILGHDGIKFRQTKDFDMVLIIEALNADFIKMFIDFVQQAGYSHTNKGTGASQFYRFEMPKDNQFPYMIEVFSRKPDYIKMLDLKIAPVHISAEVLSLSAILLDDEYYSLLVASALEIDGISVLNLECLILFKMKAWLDLSERRQRGEQIDSKNITKHKNDVIRLAANIQQDAMIAINGQVKKDAEVFLQAIEIDNVNLKSLGIRGITGKEILDRMRRCFGL